MGFNSVFEGLKTLSVAMKMNELMNMWHWWDDTDRGKLKGQQKELSQCHFVYNKPRMD